MATWTLGTLLIWVAIGTLAGLFGRRIVGGVPPFGVIGDVILGLAGGVVGGYILALLGASGGVGLVGSLVTSLLGALLLIWLSNRLRR